jgi:hypothetical protein
MQTELLYSSRSSVISCPAAIAFPPAGRVERKGLRDDAR